MWRKQLTLFFFSNSPNKQFLKNSYPKRIRPCNYCRPLSSSSSSSSCRLEVAPLKSRSLVRLRGVESRDLLQGLVTNDVTHLDGKPSIYTLLLNHQGRILFDALLSSSPPEEDESSILIECDTSFRSKLVSHLKLYRLKRKVDIEAEDKLSVWVVYDATHFSGYLHKSSGPPTPTTAYDLIDYCCDPLTKYSSKREALPVDIVAKNAAHFGDPRLPELGWRIYAPAGIRRTEELFNKSATSVSLQESEEGYKALRYSLGVGEGVVEIPFGNAFPLEANGDFLHGISFQKGCYLGQELTARTHHTGVVRKRLMPFRLSDSADKLHGDVQSFQILNEKNRPVGKVRGLLGNLGIALFRVEEALSASSLTLNDSLVTTLSKPSWWPIEAAKEISSGRKS